MYQSNDDNLSTKEFYFPFVNFEGNKQYHLQIKRHLSIKKKAFVIFNPSTYKTAKFTSLSFQMKILSRCFINDGSLKTCRKIE